MTKASAKGLPIIRIGADPEVFVRDTKRRHFVSAHPYCKGTKSSPEPWKGGAVQVDGVALEFNIPAAKNAKDFSTSIKENLYYLQGILSGWDENLRLVTTPTAIFDQKYFDSLPNEVKVLGCEPDYNAYTHDVNPKPETSLPMRTGSGHVHVGWIEFKDFIQEPKSEDHMRLCEGLVRQLDVALFIPSLLFDNDTQRRTLYGTPGAFRPKPYGLEYRVLSNRWLRNETLSSWIFNSTLKATRDYFRGNYYVDKINHDEFNNILANLSSRKISRMARHFIANHPSFCSIPRGYSDNNNNSRSSSRKAA